MDTTLDTTQKIIKPIPSTKNVFKALMRADLRVQWRNRRALIMTLIMPVVFVISWKSLIPVMGAYSVLATCIAVGLPATGLMAYSQTIARDRERGVFQRLRAAPISTSAIMLSRIAVQLCVIMLMTLVTYIVADKADGIVISAAAIPLMLVISAIGGAAYLAIGQFLVASIKSSDSVNAAARLVYFPLAIVGAIGVVLGVFVALRGNELVPKALRFKNYKAFMLPAYGLYMAGTALGVAVYLVVFAGL